MWEVRLGPSSWNICTVCFELKQHYSLNALVHEILALEFGWCNISMKTNRYDLWSSLGLCHCLNAGSWSLYIIPVWHYYSNHISPWHWATRPQEMKQLKKGGQGMWAVRKVPYHRMQYIPLNMYPDSKVHGANIGPTWVLSAPDGPHVGHMDLAIRCIMGTSWHGNTLQYWYFDSQIHWSPFQKASSTGHPHLDPVMWNFDVLVFVSLKKLLNKHSSWW